jgi:hypothetical protein
MSMARLERLSEALARLNELSKVLPPRRMTPWPYISAEWRAE